MRHSDVAFCRLSLSNVFLLFRINTQLQISPWTMEMYTKQTTTSNTISKERAMFENPTKNSQSATLSELRAKLRLHSRYYDLCDTPIIKLTTGNNDVLKSDSHGQGLTPQPPSEGGFCVRVCRKHCRGNIVPDLFP